MDLTSDAQSREEEMSSDYAEQAWGSIASEADRWRRKHAEELSRLRKERFTTSSGRQIRDVYTPLDVAAVNYASDLGFPGEPPYTRGESAAGYRGMLWNWEFYA